MNVSDELLDKYFKGQCSPEEKLLVANYLKEADDLPAHLLSKNEWDQTDDAQIDELKTEQMLTAVKKQTTPKFYHLKWIRITSAAAIAAAVLTFGLLVLNRNKPDTDLAKNKVPSTEKANSIKWKSVVNYTAHNQLFSLPDSSTVNLYPGGELSYAEPFVKHKREVYLKGKSFFQVKKDKQHAFVVYARGISTTALGTSFTITALEKSNLVKVQLHTGKVWVKNESPAKVSPFSEILLPGKELVYNSRINKVSVSDSRTSAGGQKNSTGELSFSQAPLADVFTRLEKHYKVKLIYNPADLQEMSFTGNLKLTQPIDTILEEIAGLNKLNHIKTAEGYLIRK